MASDRGVGRLAPCTANVVRIRRKQSGRATMSGVSNGTLLLLFVPCQQPFSRLLSRVLMLLRRRDGRPGTVCPCISASQWTLPGYEAKHSQRGGSRQQKSEDLSPGLEHNSYGKFRSPRCCVP
jgi:hypothetical protein